MFIIVNCVHHVQITYKYLANINNIPICNDTLLFEYIISSRIWAYKSNYNVYKYLRRPD